MRIPFYESAALLSDVQELRTRSGLQLVAAVLEYAAIPLATSDRSPRTCIAFGNETDGLSGESIRAADIRATIPMSPLVDSLNVSVAAGIFLHHFTCSSRVSPTD